MILKSDIEKISGLQMEVVRSADKGLTRESLSDLPRLGKHALIITGIRRCGKSTLLFQLFASGYPDAFYLNFSDNRLYGFENADFTRLDEIIKESGSKVLFFDEIQEIEGWDRYVRQKLDENFRLAITGSNASLLGRELGTKLTGRHISRELFPFSFSEYLKYSGSLMVAESFISYMKAGGFPEYLNAGRDEILSDLFEDILIRDIVVRYGIRDIKGLQRLALYLVSNIGKPVTGGRLKQSVGISATSTILEYFSHLESAYLFFFVPRFSYSVKSQMVSPRKVYAIDTGLVNVNSASFTDDTGRKLENMIYTFLRRCNKSIFYWSGKNECDFIVMRKGEKPLIIQVCSDLNRDNLDRELKGINEAAEFFKVRSAFILTLNQSDDINYANVNVKVVPAWKFISTLQP